MRKGFAGAAVAVAVLALPAAASATHSNGAGPKMDLVQGSGDATLYIGPSGLEVEGHINAKSDGLDAEGMFWVRFGGDELRGEVTCLNAVGNDARWGGRITAATNPLLEGRFIRGRDIDRGEGSNAPPDLHGASIAIFPPPPGQCPVTSSAPEPVTQGNVVVHDGA